LRRHGVGALAETPESVLRELDRAFADRGAVWNEWRAALAPLSRPNAAREIASHLLNLSPAADSSNAGSRDHAKVTVPE
jgi:processive 1,2-diacylglycerol beta-glucosyltransferase